MTDYQENSFRDLLERNALEFPERILIHQDTQGYSNRDIDSCATQLAQEFSRSGIKRGTHVGIYGANSVNWVCAFFAAQKLGAITVLLNPKLPVRELAVHCQIAGATHLLYGESPEIRDEAEFLEKCAATEGMPEQLISIREDRSPGEASGDADALSFRPEPDDPALMIFTSGSTGKPKCAMLSAYNVLIATSESVKSQRLTSDDRMLLILPFFHVFGLVAGLISCAISGAEIYLPENMHVSTLLSAIERNKITVFHAVPTMMLMLTGNKEFSPERMRSLRCTILSGAAATEEQTRHFKEQMPWIHFLTSYGLSEVAPVTILPYDDTLENLLTTVGLVMPHIKAEVRNFETNQVCAPGETGEIVVKSDTLMIGYYRVRVEDQSIDGDGWLHTGDLGYFREDGYLCFAGRLKELIIKGGENIQPGDVASAVSELSEIKDVKVVGVPSEFYGEEVCACVVLKEGAVFNEEKAKAALKDRLAGFKIPSKFLIYDEFPLLGSGKIDGVTLKKDAEKRWKDG